MRNSFRWILFANILISAILVVFANRVAVQILLPLQVKDELKKELISYIDECGELLPNQDAFQSCIQASQKMSLVKGYTGRYVVCTEKATTFQNEACSGAFNKTISWNLSNDFPDKKIQITELEVEKSTWMAARYQGRAEPPTVVLLSLDDVSLEVSRMLRVYRDRNTVYVLPILLFFVLLMTWHVFTVAMRPIKQLDDSIKTLDLKSFEFETALVAPYKEFQNLVSSFENLRKRLIQSFEKARRFASDASHELRTPLTILRGNAEAMIKDFSVGSSEQVRMQMLTSEIDRLVTITQKLLWLSRADANKLQPVFQEINLSDVMNQWVLDAQTFNPNLELLADIETKVMWRCDPDLIHQLIANLYDNAVKYNVANGWIRFSLRCVEPGFCLSIENPSSPLPNDFETLAFERFYRSDDARSREVDGLGLGLSLCQEIAAVHEAQIKVKVSDEGIVIFTLTNSPQIT